MMKLISGRRQGIFLPTINCLVATRFFLLSTSYCLLSTPLMAADWPMLGGTAQRNMVNTSEKKIPNEWSVKEGEQKNVKWVAELGTTSYGGPVVASGKVFVGTNNGRPRNPSRKGDKGVVMCFRESDGQFL